MSSAGRRVTSVKRGKHVISVSQARQSVAKRWKSVLGVQLREHEANVKRVENLKRGNAPGSDYLYDVTHHLVTCIS